MPETLLKTKFYIPYKQPDLVSRPRLIEKLNDGLHRKLILISAPAGYGKTTLITEWLHHAKNIDEREKLSIKDWDYPKKFTWLTLDRSDDDLGRFMAYFTAALQQVHPHIGEGISEALQTPRSPDPHTLATWLINDLAELPDRFILVLDDYHLITEQPIHDFLAFLIDHQPPQICMVIATRADPALPLARMRAQGQLTELRQGELRFTMPEVEIFLKNVMEINLTAEQLDTLEDRTEGWIAGLQLAALSMRNISDIPSFIGAFSGGNMHIADFLTGEVLNQQPNLIRTFLLQTSILERFSAPLCEAVTGNSSAQENLEQLMEENMFLVQLDHQREWYRYHALFADMLRKRLYQTYGDSANELHLRASQWYGANEMLSPAIEHALAGKSYDRAAEFIKQFGEEFLKRGEPSTLHRWLEAIPMEIQLAHPILLIYSGLVLLLSSKPPDAAKTPLEELLSSGKLEDVKGELQTFQGLMALMQGDTREAIRLSEEALQYLSPNKNYFCSLAADNLGMAYTLQGDSNAATRAFEQAVQISERSDNVMMTLGALSNLAGLLVLQGKLRAAADAYQRVLRIAAERLGKRSQLTGKAILGLGMLAREWNDLDGALQYFEDATEMFEGSIEIGLPIVYLSIAMVKLNQGDEKSAQTYLDKAYQYSQASTSTTLDDKLTEETQVRFWIAQGKLELAHEWMLSNGFLEPSFVEALKSSNQGDVSGVLAQQNTYLALARLYLAKNQPEHALKILEPMLELFNKKGYIRRVVEIMALKALALKKQAEIDSALQVLDQALTLAKPEGYQRTFLDAGESMGQLLYLAATEGMHPRYIGSLLAGFSKEVDKSSIVKPAVDSDEPLIEPLSQRELEVLNLLAEGLSNREIGSRLHISLSTVKGHTTQIYGKLNVKSRTQAVAKGRTLGLLPLL